MTLEKLLHALQEQIASGRVNKNTQVIMPIKETTVYPAVGHDIEPVSGVDVVILGDHEGRPEMAIMLVNLSRVRAMLGE